MPEIALRELGPITAQPLSDDLLAPLDREAMLAWNPRVVRVWPNAARIATRLHHVLNLS